MNNPSSKSVDEIFTQFGYVCADNDYLFDYEIAELNKAKIELYQLIKDRVIDLRPYQTITYDMYRHRTGKTVKVTRRNKLSVGKKQFKEQQLAALNELFGVKDDE